MSGLPAAAPELDVRNITREADRLLGVVEDPRQRAILRNFRRHGVLEALGRWPEILAPEMTVAHPVYRIVVGGQTMVYDGAEEVAGFYRGLAEAGVGVYAPVEENIAVADWGLAAESLHANIMPGRFVLAIGESVDDPDAVYLGTSRVASFWPFDENARLIGEHVYEDASARRFWKMNPADIPTPERVAELLTPLLADPDT